MTMNIEMIITHRPMFHSNSHLEDDNVDNGGEDNDDDVSQGCVSQ